MKTFLIEYELPPLRAIYNGEIDAETEQEARDAFQSQMRIHRIRKVTEVETTLTQCGDSHGYLCDIHGNTGHTGDHHKAPVGDQGQRYMVVADFDGVEKPIGYTSNPTGGSLMEGAKKWPACSNPRVVDRKPE